MVKNSNYLVNKNWSEKVEELVDKGELNNAVSLLESVISDLDTLDPDSASDNLRLAAAISDLAELESSRGYSDKADELRSKAYVMKNRGVDGSNLVERSGWESLEKIEDEEVGNLGNLNYNQEEEKEEDVRFGTGHVLVLYGFSPTTQTIDLEKLYDKFQDRGVAIRWVNDTTALAVFRTPVIAHEALNSVRCPFKVLKLDEKDEILRQNSKIDLEPPTFRPKTSARTAQRLIAQGMGIKLATNFGAKELRVQENERKNRIIARQTMKDDAWGAD